MNIRDSNPYEPVLLYQRRMLFLADIIIQVRMDLMRKGPNIIESKIFHMIIPKDIVKSRILHVWME